MIATITRNEIFKQAFERASKTTKKVSPVGLAHHANIVAMNLRDEWIHMQAEKIGGKLGSRVLQLWPLAYKRLMTLDQSYLQTFDDSDIADPDSGPNIVAHAIGVIRWYRLLYTGQVNQLFINEQLAADWLARSQDFPAAQKGQLSFLGVME